MTATLTREQRRMALQLYRDCWADGEWGITLDHWFAAAEVAYHGGAELPAWWKYEDGQHGRDYLLECMDPESGGIFPDCEYVHFLDAGELGLRMLVYAGNTLGRYLNRLERAGLREEN